jgi:hypothetical protein
MDTPLDKKLIGNQDKLPENLKAKIEAAPESPVKFMGGIAASVARSGSGGGSGLFGDISTGIFGQVNRAIAEKEQSDYRANANVGDPKELILLVMETNLFLRRSKTCTEI